MANSLAHLSTRFNLRQGAYRRPRFPVDGEELRQTYSHLLRIFHPFAPEPVRSTPSMSSVQVGGRNEVREGQGQQIVLPVPGTASPLPLQGKGEARYRPFNLLQVFSVHPRLLLCSSDSTPRNSARAPLRGHAEFLPTEPRAACSQVWDWSYHLRIGRRSRLEKKRFGFHAGSACDR
jgi:hypothetical protein